MKHSFKLNLLILLATPNLFAQKSISDSAIFTHLIHGSLSLQLPGNDLAGRFGQFAQVGPGYMFKTRTNWIFGIESNFIFGGVVKNSENILQSIATSDGNIIDLEGTYADFHLTRWPEQEK